MFALTDDRFEQGIGTGRPGIEDELRDLGLSADAPRWTVQTLHTRGDAVTWSSGPPAVEPRPTVSGAQPAAAGMVQRLPARRLEIDLQLPSGRRLEAGGRVASQEAPRRQLGVAPKPLLVQGVGEMQPSASGGVTQVGVGAGQDRGVDTQGGSEVDGVVPAQLLFFGEPGGLIDQRPICIDQV